MSQNYWFSCIYFVHFWNYFNSITLVSCVAILILQCGKVFFFLEIFLFQFFILTISVVLRGERFYGSLVFYGEPNKSHEVVMFVTKWLSLMRFWCLFVASTPESIHTKDESKRGIVFAFIFGVKRPVQWVQSVNRPNHI